MRNTLGSVSIIYWRQLGFIFIMVGAVSLLLSTIIQFDAYIFHFIFCIISLLIIFFTIYRNFRFGLDVILIDHRIIFSFSYALYFIIGPLQLIIGSQEDIDKTFTMFTINASNALKIDGMNSFGFGFALLVSSIYNPKFLPNITKLATKTFKRINIFWITSLFLSVGALAFYVTLNDWVYGKTISGLWRLLSNFILVGILLSSLYKGKYQKIFWFVAFLFTLIISFNGLLSFSKSLLLLPLMAFVLGWGVRTNSLRVFFGGALVVIFLFNSIAGVFAYARSFLSQETSGTFSQRVDLIFDGINASISQDIMTAYTTHSRFNYMHSHLAAIDFYNNGNGGNDFSKLPWIFVPRFLNSRKPVMTESGTEFYYKMTGHYGSSEASGGVFGDGYYNLGWVGVFLWSALIGFILANNSAIASIIIKTRSYLLLPIVFLGLLIAFRIDGILIADFLGSFNYIVFCLLSITIISFAKSLVARKNTYLV